MTGPACSLQSDGKGRRRKTKVKQPKSNAIQLKLSNILRDHQGPTLVSRICKSPHVQLIDFLSSEFEVRYCDPYVAKDSVSGSNSQLSLSPQFLLFSRALFIVYMRF